MAEVINMIRKSGIQLSLDDVAEKIMNDVGAEPITQNRIDLGEGKLAIFVGMEDYYFRVKNYVSLSIMLTDDNYVQRAVIMGSGGGDGLLNFSWGANKSLAKRGEKALLALGFSYDV